MRPFRIVPDSQPEPTVQAVFQEMTNTLGFVPNLFRVVADSVPALLALFNMNSQFSESSLSDVEQEVVALTVSAENQCTYCMSAHTLFAINRGAGEATIRNLRHQKEIGDVRLNALRTFTLRLMQTRGHATQADLIHFFDSGFAPTQAIEVVLGITLKTFTNYISSLTAVSLDPAFEDFAWSPSTPLSIAADANLERSLHHG